MSLAWRSDRSGISSKRINSFRTRSRKHALCAIGYCDAMTVVCGSKTAAPQIANAFRLKDQYCIATVKGDVVTVFTARSMARRALPKPEFIRVADRVFDYIHQITGIDANKAGQAA